MGVVELITAATFLLGLVIMVALMRCVESGGERLPLRPLPALQALRRQVGMALESGYPPLFALGRGALHTSAGPASVAGTQLLQELAESSGRGQLTPQVTVGAATLLPIAEESLRRALDESQEAEGDQTNVRFIAEDVFPFTYAAGTADAIERENIVSTIAVGRFGSELAIIAEAANQRGVEQLMGSDDPAAIAIAFAATENSLWGEEIFAAGAYLRENAWGIAAVRTQDILRWLLIIASLGAALIHILDLV